MCYNLRARFFGLPVPSLRLRLQGRIARQCLDQVDVAEFETPLI
jgi:hypothetical protein